MSCFHVLTSLSEDKRLAFLIHGCMKKIFVLTSPDHFYMYFTRTFSKKFTFFPLIFFYKLMQIELKLFEVSLQPPTKIIETTAKKRCCSGSHKTMR